MKHWIWLIAALMLLAPGAYGFSYSVVGNGAGCSATFSVPTEESVASSIVLDAGSISNTISGRGDLHENHFVRNGAGASALVRASVMNASSYTYSYELSPDPAVAQDAPTVFASESLDVDRADYIRALALAASGELYSSASTEVRGGSLLGYYNRASASANNVMASQSLDSATGDLLTYSRSEYGSGAERSAHVTTSVQGNLTAYSERASSFVGGANIREDSHIVGSFWSDATAGNQTKIRTSNFGTEFDLTRYAPVGKSSGGLRGSIVKDSTGYHISGCSGTGVIQKAVNASSDGDTIYIEFGYFYDNLKITKSINLIGGSTFPTIDGSKGSKSVITVSGGVTCNITSLILTRGYAFPDNGGGIYNDNSTVNLEKVDITNSVAGYGGGIYNDHGTMTMYNICIKANKAIRDTGPAIYNDHGTLNLRSPCIIVCNQGIKLYSSQPVYNDGGTVNT